MARKRGWHFLTRQMKSERGTEGRWRDGEVRELDLEPRLCEQGYHASLTILDAYSYASEEFVLCRVELSGVIVEGEDKCVATRRRLLWHLTGKQTKKLLDAFGVEDEKRGGGHEWPDAAANPWLERKARAIHRKTQ